MIQLVKPVRKNVPQQPKYTFLDENNAIIDLTNYVSAAFEAKVQGAIYSTTVATIVSPPTLGQVLLAFFTFTTTGIWTIQFVCMDVGGGKLYGEPMQLTVIDNVDDMSLQELLTY